MSEVGEARFPSFENLEGRARVLERSFFRFRGPDRVRYLNGQVSNDVARLDGSGSLPACLCSIKGKVEALVWIRAEGESLLVDGEPGQRDFLHARFEKYLIADDCEVEDATDEFDLVHHFSKSHPGSPSRRLLLPGRDLLVPKGSERVAGLAEIPRGEWERLELLSRLPAPGREIQGDEFPSELGLDAWAVDYHKGCYLGQEIVSRLRSVGRARKRLALVASPQPLDRGVAVRLEDGFGGVTTRKSVPLGENRHVAPALVAAANQKPQGGDFQAVIEISGEFPQL